jgi:phosphoglucosamine mutase
MSKHYFGTDGVRGRVGEAPITPDFALKLGWAAGRVLANGDNPLVLIGKDTRLSGYMLESALESGFAAAGVNVALLGPIPTPGIAYLTRTFNARAGVVISASHNPYGDNGVKFFDSRGHKLADNVEEAIESTLEKPLVCAPSEAMGRAQRINDAPGRYIEFCKSSFREMASLSAMRVVVDCAHGAAYHIAPHVFSELGAEVIPIGNQPDGLNINDGFGSTQIETLQSAVLENGADVGIALDGDGDRCIMVDSTGNAIDGDQLLYIIAESRWSSGAMRGPVVGTQMTNLGLELALQTLDLELCRAKVGDRYVMEELHKRDGIIGGESSGHVICLDRSTTGDGIITALQVLAVMTTRARTLAELASNMRLCPQALENVEIDGEAEFLLQASTVRSAVSEVESSLNGQGRVLLRPSGTEPLIRVMVEGLNASEVSNQAQYIADSVRQSARAR